MKTPVPRDTSGRPLVDCQAWAAMSEAERRLCAYQNSPHKQLVGLHYRPPTAKKPVE